MTITIYIITQLSKTLPLTEKKMVNGKVIIQINSNYKINKI